MIVYLSTDVDHEDFQPIEIPDLEIARSLARGLIASSRQFIFKACGFVAVRGGDFAPVVWYRERDDGMLQKL